MNKYIIIVDIHLNNPNAYIYVHTSDYQQTHEQSYRDILISLRAPNHESKEQSPKKL